MCGIWGSVNKRITREKANYCCDTLSHRGPDGKGLWFSADNSVVLGHRRLSIIDLSENGKQPMSYANERYWITFNGEIYNYLEIRTELEEDGYIFISDCDTEVILASYCKWGEECVNKFNGMWAFAIYDQEEKSIFLSRDRFGVKPLYYSYNNEELVFGSEMKSIIPCLDRVEINMDMINFYRYLHHYEFKRDCLIKGIRRFPAGYNGQFKNGKLKIKRYWNTLDNLIDVPKEYDEQVEVFRDLFIDSCKLRMRSDVTIGTALSGGLDSSAVICAMNNVARKRTKNIQNDWQHAYVAGFKGSKLDETCYAKKVTDYIGINNTIINMENDLSEDKLIRQAYLFEELWMNSQMPIMGIYEAERKNGTVVSIDGHGADELFSGYTMNMQFALLDSNDEEQFNIAKMIRESETIGDISDEDICIWTNRRIKKVKIRNNYEKFYRRIILNCKDIKRNEYKNYDNLTKSLYIETHQKILPTMLRNYDRNSMASGVEIRMPFMDYRLIQFAFSIPWNSKVRNGYSKAIIRDALKDIMPHEICYRKDKKGLNAPINEWIRGAKELYLDIVNSQEFKNSSVVKNPKKIKDELIKFINNENNNYVIDLVGAQKIWMEINMYIWEKSMIRRRI